MIILDKGKVLESTANFTGTGLYSDPNGVRIRPIEAVLEEITTIKNRIGVNHYEDSVPE
jgi:hypothetical protein